MSITNGITGSSAGVVNLIQTVVGGAGGAAAGGTPGAAGNSTSDLNLTLPSSDTTSNVTLVSDSTAGAGG